ncbi:hypothetical protein [Streptomyces sp. NPDC003015]
MRSRTRLGATVLLVALVTLQGAAPALADGRQPNTPSASIDPFTPFAQGASTLVDMAAPFVNAASDTVFPRR